MLVPRPCVWLERNKDTCQLPGIKILDGQCSFTVQGDDHRTSDYQESAVERESKNDEIISYVKQFCTWPTIKTKVCLVGISVWLQVTILKTSP